MKLINNNGIEISEEEFKANLAKIEEKLQFYADGDFYEWEGCHCHGRNIILDTGEKANEGLNILNEIKWMMEDKIE